MSKIKIILLFLFTSYLLKSVAYAELSNNYCDALQELISSNDADYKESERLKYLCWTERQASPNRQLINLIKGFNLNQALQSAYQQRITKRQKIAEQLSQVTGDFAMEIKETSNQNFDNSYFSEKLLLLSKLQSNLDLIKKDNFNDNLSPEAKYKAKTIYNFSNDNLTGDAMVIARTLISEIENFSSKSDAKINAIDQKLQNTITNGYKTIDTYRTKTTFAQSQQVRDDFLNSISPQILQLKTTNAWGQYLSKNKISRLFTQADFSANYGMTDSAKNTLSTISKLTDYYLAKLPNSISEQIKSLDSYIKIKSQIEVRQNNISAIPANEIKKRQFQYLEYQMSNLSSLKSTCLAQHPAFQQRWTAIESDYKKIKPLDAFLSTNHSELERVFLESLSTRMSIFSTLCQDGAK